MIIQVVPARRMPLSLNFFDYSVPKKLEQKIQVGQLVSIPFRKQEIFGVVFKVIKERPDKTIANIKDILKIISLKPALSCPQLNFLIEISQFYHTSLGFLLKSNLMPLQKRKLSKLNDLKSDENQDTKISAAKQPTLVTYQKNEDKINYIVKNLDLKKQNLILVPEVGSLKEINLSAKFKDKTLIISSELTTKELYEAWTDIWLGKKKIIIGTRRALFMPLYNLANIFLIDESNPNYKSWDMTPRINTRDAALMLQKFHGAKLRLLTHTPSVESYYFAHHKIYSKKTLSVPDKSNFPTVIDMRLERKAGNYSFLSDQLVKKIIELKNKKIFLFLNKRGTASYVGCRDCGQVSKCNKCKVLLTYHQDKNSLLCHYCNTAYPFTHNCSKCNGLNMTMYGVGTQMVENEVKKILGAKNRDDIIRVDSDRPVLTKIKQNIVIGTQLAWSYVDWNNLDLVVFVDADTSLFVPEYKVAESLRFLVRDALSKMQKNAELVIQTTHLDHVVFKTITDSDKFYIKELKERKFLGYPPYKFLLKFFFGHASKHAVTNEVSQLQTILNTLTKDNLSIKLTDPLETTPYHYRGKYWQVVLAKISYKTYKKDTLQILKLLPKGWKVDPNPNTILSI